MIISKLHYSSQGSTPEDHLINIQKACTYGIELVQLHLKDVTNAHYLEIAKAARDITLRYQTRLVITHNYEVAKAVKAEGVILENLEDCPTQIRPKLYSWQMIGGIAKTLEDCRAFLAKDVDYIALGPFASTSDTSSSNTLSIDNYNAINKALHTEKPIIAFGAIEPNDVTALLEAGVAGITLADGITTNFDTIKRFNELLQASATGEIRHTFE
ncbi:thiamine phosphate synthase [Winogradskyella sediminis]|uniref:Thiamine-phosphate pyrophosphorylase n=2 Tax=Winogradskyella sediminis TaxID=1382466 RepID=A0A1H1XHQ8_9FLAO|nr:thiamine phosphate synthase [Winogradskyella sediminis]SDT08672.1 thiamine-phosphate pyrophosphorylase [Winogradskyella sediminis]